MCIYSSKLGKNKACSLEDGLKKKLEFHGEYLYPETWEMCVQCSVCGIVLW